MRDLAGEELEEAVQLGGVASHGRRERGRVEVFGRLERAHLELEPVAETVDPPEHPDGVALGEAAVQEVDVGPDPRFDPPARVDELERQVRGAAARPQPLLLGDRVHAFDDAVRARAPRSQTRTESRPGSGCYGPRALAEIKPFRALRYDDRAGRSARGARRAAVRRDRPEERERYLAQSPHNVVHLTLPDVGGGGRTRASGRGARKASSSRRGAGLLGALAGLRRPGRRRPHARPASSARSGSSPTRRAPSCRTSGRIAGPRRAAFACFARCAPQLEPIFLLYEGAAPFELPDGPPDLEVEGTRLWRLRDEELGAAFADRRLLIADGHHRYETALAYHEEDGTPESGYMMVVLVSLEDPGLTIFPDPSRLRDAAAGRVDAARAQPRETPRRRSKSSMGCRTSGPRVVVYERRDELVVDGAEASSTSSSSTGSATRVSRTRPTGARPFARSTRARRRSPC